MAITKQTATKIASEMMQVEDKLVELHKAFESDVEMIDTVKITEALVFNNTRLIDEPYLTELYVQYVKQYNAVKFDLLKQLVYLKEELLELQIGVDDE